MVQYRRNTENEKMTVLEATNLLPFKIILLVFDVIILHHFPPLPQILHIAPLWSLLNP